MWQKTAGLAGTPAAWLALGAAALLAAPGAGRAAERPAERPLAAPVEARSLETIARSLVAVAQAHGRLVLVPTRSTFAIAAPFDPHGEGRTQTFGPLTAQTRLALAKGRWTGLDLLEGRALLLEGEELAVAEADPQTLAELARRTLPWDRLLPPRDRGGEATAPETAALRARFKASLLATPGVKLVGMAPLPSAWQASRGRAYLLATRIPGFPLLMMECQADPPSACVVTRQCLLEGAAELAPGSVTGLAISAARRHVVIGDRRRHRLVAFRFESCLHVPRRAELPLPPRLPPLANLAVDADDRLWVATEVPDDYLNASLFYWPKAAW